MTSLAEQGELPFHDEGKIEGYEDNDQEEKVGDRSDGRTMPMLRRDEVEDNSDRNNDNMSSGTDTLVDHFLFFMAGLGSSIGYIATLSSLVYFQHLLGDNSFVWLNLAVYIPLVPISIAQAKWDQRYDMQYATRVTFFFRGVVGYGLVLGGTLGLIALPSSFSITATTTLWIFVLSCALFQGTGGAILYGKLNQLASLMINVNGSSDNGSSTSSSSSPRIQATVSAGVQASALVVLVVSWSSGFRTMNASKFTEFMTWIFILQMGCGGCCLFLLMCRQQVLISMMRRDDSIVLLPQQPDLLDQRDNDGSVQQQQRLPLLERRREASSNNNVDDSGQDDRNSFYSGDLNSEEESYLELSFRELWHYSQSCCFILAITLIPSFLVGSWFTRVKTKVRIVRDGQSSMAFLRFLILMLLFFQWMELPQVLFYVRIASDFVGRLATLLRKPHPSSSGSSTSASRTSNGIRCVLCTACLRWGIVILFFVNATVQAFLSPHKDIASILLVAAIAFLSGYLVTSCYQLAPRQLPEGPVRANNSTKQASLLTVAFAFSALAGLVSSFVLMAVGI